MNQPKFTNGPWVFSNTNDYEIEQSGSGMTICTYYVGEKSEQQDLANASLIAAAPDLFTACEIVLNNLVEKPLEPMGYLAYKASIDALVAALNKARGES